MSDEIYESDLQAARARAAERVAAQQRETERLAAIARRDPGCCQSMTQAEWRDFLHREYGIEGYEAREVVLPPAPPDLLDPSTDVSKLSDTDFRRACDALTSASTPARMPPLPPGVTSALDLSPAEWQRYREKLGVADVGAIGSGCVGAYEDHLQREQAVRREREQLDLQRRTCAALEALAKQAAAPQAKAEQEQAAIEARRAEARELRNWADRRGR